MIQKLDTFTLATDRSYQFECTATIYQDRNLDLPWKTNNAETIGKTAWPDPDIDWSRTLVILGTEDTAYGFPVKFIQKYVTLSNVDNLLLNMMSGLLPEHLSKEEVELLIDRFGNNWFSELGYSEAEGYKIPTFE